MSFEGSEERFDRLEGILNGVLGGQMTMLQLIADTNARFSDQAAGFVSLANGQTAIVKHLLANPLLSESAKQELAKTVAESEARAERMEKVLAEIRAIKFPQVADLRPPLLPPL
jgi:hypothetical protein